jgi:hypothetical protein
MVGDIPGAPPTEMFYQISPSEIQFGQKQGIKLCQIDKNGVKARIIIGVKSDDCVIGNHEGMYYWQWHRLLDSSI